MNTCQETIAEQSEPQPRVQTAREKEADGIREELEHAEAPAAAVAGGTEQQLQEEELSSNNASTKTQVETPTDSQANPENAIKNQDGDHLDKTALDSLYAASIAVSGSAVVEADRALYTGSESAVAALAMDRTTAAFAHVYDGLSLHTSASS